MVPNPYDNEHFTVSDYELPVGKGQVRLRKLLRSLATM